MARVVLNVAELCPRVHCVSHCCIRASLSRRLQLAEAPHLLAVPLPPTNTVSMLDCHIGPYISACSHKLPAHLSLSLARARPHTRPLMSDPITFANCESCGARRSVLCALAGALSLSLDGRRKCTLGLIDKQRKISLGRIVSGSLISCSSEETMSRRLEIAVSIRNETKGNRVRARLRMLKGESYAKVRKQLNTWMVNSNEPELYHSHRSDSEEERKEFGV